MNKQAAGLRGRSAKIVATLGPGSSAPGTIRLLAEAGVDVFRLNFSHGEQEKHKQTYDFIRQTEDLLGRPLAVLADLQGPKIRVGKFPDGALQLKMRAAAEAEGITLPAGVYAWFSGPSFETPAEIRAIRTLGADAVGMSTVPENILAQRLGMKVAAVSLITNFAAGMTGADLSHDETKSEADKAKPQFSRLIRAFVRGHE